MLISPFSVSVKKLQGMLGAHGMCLRGVMGLHHPLIFLGGPSRGVKSVDRSTSKRTIPVVFSYISSFVCSYNLNYTGRPLRGPGIIVICDQCICGKCAFNVSCSLWYRQLQGMLLPHNALLVLHSGLIIRLEACGNR